MIEEEGNICPHIHEQIWEKKCAFFEPEVGKRVICDVKFAFRKILLHDHRKIPISVCPMVFQSIAVSWLQFCAIRSYFLYSFCRIISAGAMRQRPQKYGKTGIN